MAGINSSSIASDVATCTRPRHCFRLGMAVLSQFLWKLKPNQAQQRRCASARPVSGLDMPHCLSPDAYFKLGAAISPLGLGGQLAVEAGAHHHHRAEGRQEGRPSYVRGGQKLVQ